MSGVLNTTFQNTVNILNGGLKINQGKIDVQNGQISTPLLETIGNNGKIKTKRIESNLPISIDTSRLIITKGLLSCNKISTINDNGVLEIKGTKFNENGVTLTNLSCGTMINIGGDAIIYDNINDPSKVTFNKNINISSGSGLNTKKINAPSGEQILFDSECKFDHKILVTEISSIAQDVNFNKNIIAPKLIANNAEIDNVESGTCKVNTKLETNTIRPLINASITIGDKVGGATLNCTGDVVLRKDLYLGGNDINNVNNITTSTVTLDNIVTSTLNGLTIQDINIFENVLSHSSNHNNININNIKTSKIVDSDNSDPLKIQFGQDQKGVNSINFNDRVSITRNGIILYGSEGADNYIELGVTNISGSTTKENRLTMKSDGFDLVVPNIKDLVFVGIKSKNDNIIIITKTNSGDGSKAAFRVFEDLVYMTFELNLSVNFNTPNIELFLPDNYKANKDTSYNSIFIEETIDDSPSPKINMLDGYIKISPEDEIQIYKSNGEEFFGYQDTQRHSYKIYGVASYTLYQNKQIQPYLFKSGFNFQSSIKYEIKEQRSRYILLDSFVTVKINVTIKFTDKATDSDPLIDFVINSGSDTITPVNDTYILLFYTYDDRIYNIRAKYSGNGSGPARIQLNYNDLTTSAKVIRENINFTSIFSYETYQTRRINDDIYSNNFFF